MNMVKKVSLFHSTNDMNGKRWILLWASTGKYLSKEWTLYSTVYQVMSWLGLRDEYYVQEHEH